MTRGGGATRQGLELRAEGVGDLGGLVVVDEAGPLARGPHGPGHDRALAGLCRGLREMS